MRSHADARVNRFGLTLIELLVVIAIIGVLVGLLLASVQKVRESASRLSCANNLKQLGLALHQYHDHQRAFPPAALTTPKSHGWTPFILPHLEQQNLAGSYDWSRHWFDPINQPVVTTPLPLLMCPSSPQSQRLATGTTGAISWSAAVSDYGLLRIVNAILEDDGYIPPTGSRAGLLNLNKAIRMTDVADGVSNTLLVIEDAGRPQRWERGQMIAGKTSNGGGWADVANSSSLDGYDVATGFFLGECAVNCTNNNEIYSFHSGGANLLFGDGSVHFVYEGIGIRIAAALVTRAGGEVVPGFD